MQKYYFPRFLPIFISCLGVAEQIVVVTVAVVFAKSIFSYRADKRYWMFRLNEENALTTLDTRFVQPNQRGPFHSIQRPIWSCPILSKAKHSYTEGFSQCTGCTQTVFLLSCQCTVAFKTFTQSYQILWLGKLLLWFMYQNVLAQHTPYRSFWKQLELSPWMWALWTFCPLEEQVRKSKDSVYALQECPCFRLICCRYISFYWKEILQLYQIKSILIFRNNISTLGIWDFAIYIIISAFGLQEGRSNILLKLR